MKKHTIEENGEKITILDLSKDFDNFIKKNEKLLKELSKY